MQPLRPKKNHGTSRDERNYKTSLDKKIMHPLGTKTNHATSQDKKNNLTSWEENKSHKLLGPKKIMPPLVTNKKSCNLSGQQKNCATSWDKKITQPLRTIFLCNLLGTGNQKSIKLEEVGNRLKQKIKKIKKNGTRRKIKKQKKQEIKNRK